MGILAPRVSRPTRPALHAIKIWFFPFLFTNFSFLENLSTTAALRLRLLRCTERRHRHSTHTVVVNPLCAAHCRCRMYVRVKTVAIFSIEWFERLAHRRCAAKISEPEYDICRLSIFGILCVRRVRMVAILGPIKTLSCTCLHPILFKIILQDQ